MPSQLRLPQPRLPQQHLLLPPPQQLSPPLSLLPPPLQQ